MCILRAGGPTNGDRPSQAIQPANYVITSRPPRTDRPNWNGTCARSAESLIIAAYPQALYRLSPCYCWSCCAAIHGLPTHGVQRRLLRFHLSDELSDTLDSLLVRDPRADSPVVIYLLAEFNALVTHGLFRICARQSPSAARDKTTSERNCSTLNRSKVTFSLKSASLKSLGLILTFLVFRRGAGIAGGTPHGRANRSRPCARFAEPSSHAAGGSLDSAHTSSCLW